MQQLTECPVCQSEQITLWFEGRSSRRRSESKTWPVFECRSCNLGFLNPQPSWAELEPYYDAAYGHYSADFGVEDTERQLASARATGKLRHVEIKSGQRLLDVGCGGGGFLHLARKLGAEVQGIEPSAHGAATANAQGIPVFNGTVEDYRRAHPDARFDLITANHVVEHHHDPVALLRQMKDMLAPDGGIWISVPNAGSATARALEWRWHCSDLPYHLVHFTVSSIRKAAELAGLGVTELGTHTIPDHLRYSLLSLWQKRYLLPLKLTRHLGLGGMVERKAKALDATVAGEAILIELVPA